MEKQSTAHMIEPELYAIYMLVLKHGISPQRVLKMWRDNNHYTSGRGTIKEIVRNQLEAYWQIHGFNRAGDNLTNPESTIDFIKKYINKPSFFNNLLGKS